MKKLLLFIALTIFGLGLNAQYVGDETTIDYDGYSLKFKITSVEPAECEVSGYTDSPTDVIIPSSVEISGTEFNVTSIGERGFDNCSSLTSIEIPSSVTSIGWYAFSDCSSLTSIDIPSSVTSIGYYAFYRCSSLTSIEIPNSVTSIGVYAFSGCSSLTSIEIPNSVTSIGNYAFSGCSSLTSIEIPNSVTSIGFEAFSGCSSLTSIEIPNSVTSIGICAFRSCSSLTSITFGDNPQLTSIRYKVFSYCSSLTSIDIPSSVTSIGNNAFENCSSLTSIEIPNSVTSIGNNAFENCSSLTSIEIPNSVTSIGDGAFADCSSITSIIVVEGNTVYDSRENCNAIIETSSNKLIAGCQNTVIPNTVTSIGSSAFSYCSSLTSIEIPNSVTSIGSSAFDECSSLTSITFGDNSQLTSIGNNAFCYCRSLTSIEIPNSVTSIGDGAFAGCSSLASVTFEDNPQLTSIGYKAFYYCKSLTSIEIPNSVTSIGDGAFDECLSLTSITFGDNPQLTSIGEYAFSECSSLTSIEIPNSVTSIGDYAFWCCSSLTSIVVAEGNTVYDSRENCNAIIETTSNTLIVGCQNTVIPNSVTFIGDYAFYDCSSLTSIEIPNSVTSIGDHAFYNCRSLTNIEIPSSVTFIGDYAFYDCSSLTSIEIPNSVTSIGSSAFSYCSSLTSIEIPNSVTSIGDWAFYRCKSLRVIKCYADNVPETGDNVFNYCPSDMIIYVPEVSLEDYKSASPWNAFTILSLNEGPRNIIATTDSAFSVNLSWDNCYADSYNVYRNGDSIANVTNPTYTDIDLEYNTEYCYTVTAVRNKIESDKSEEVCAKTLDLPITTPENLVAEALSTSSISLSWNEVENALSYNIYQSNELIANIEETTFTIDSLEYNTEYCYTVTAVRNETESDKSEEKCVKTLDLPITTPENLVAEALSTSSIILTWDNVENALSYNVYRDGEMIINVTNTNYTDKDLEYNTEYCYTVTAVRNDEESDKSEEKCAKTLGESINELSSSINIYPNPVENELFIATEVRVNEVLIYDIYGRQTMSLQVNETTSQQVVKVADLEAGVYFVKVVTNAGEIVKRFVKK